VGIGILSAGIILAIMIIPFIASVMRDVFDVTPPMLKESAYALGSTTWEVVSKVVLPYTKAGVVGGIMLGLGRALGETMAVTFVIGNFNQLDSLSLFQPPTASPRRWPTSSPRRRGLHQASLIYLGLVLFFITFVVLALSKLLLARLRRNEGRSRERHRRQRCCAARPMPAAPARAPLRLAQARQPGRAGAVAGGHGLRRVLAGVDPVRDRPARASAA
jgi:ABC-type Fe3+ transport system permease subunit